MNLARKEWPQPIDSIECWLESRKAGERLMLAVPERNHVESGGFRLTLCNDQGEHIGWIVFAHRINVRGQAVFEAVEVLTARCPKPSQPDALSGVLSLLMVGRADGQ